MLNKSYAKYNLDANVSCEISPMGKLSLGISEIQEYQRNRYPYLLIDRITEVVPGKYAKGYKNYTLNEWFFPPHYDGNPMVPGVLLLESMVQVFLMTFQTLPEYKGKLVTSLGYDSVKLKAMVVPGDRFDIETELLSLSRGIAKGRTFGYVDGKLACQAIYMSAIPEVLQQYSPR